MFSNQSMHFMNIQKQATPKSMQITNPILNNSIFLVLFVILIYTKLFIILAMDMP